MGAILLGLVPALGWGFQGVVMQKVGGSTANKQMGMVLSTLLVGILVLIFHPISWSWTLIAAAAVNGIPWSIGQILQIKSFDYLGVSRAIPVSTGMQLLGTTLLGAVVFGEWKTAGQFVLGIAALVIIIIGVTFTSYQQQGSATVELRKGLIALVISSLAFISYATAGTFFAVDSWDLLFPQAIAMFLATTVIATFMSRGRVFDSQVGVFGAKSWKNMLSGALFAVANLTVMLSVQPQFNGVAVGWTLSQMNVIFATLGGLFILREQKTKKELVFVIIGMVLVAVSGVLIGITKAG